MPSVIWIILAPILRIQKSHEIIDILGDLESPEDLGTPGWHSRLYRMEFRRLRSHLEMLSSRLVYNSKKIKKGRKGKEKEKHGKERNRKEEKRTEGR